ncbi:CynX/NimT family MFS transporter [Streptomyces meridianus]|uniref:MFS transporter n=1 Tax=Streptomyces meridianus TaxID=2938945 RepID=A0ABT0X6D2_9ACTN|nr:MFS transporter [Streptomyces meridianus]MCM2577488.1 MFS transporter [Streptomyces meridianus]
MADDDLPDIRRPAPGGTRVPVSSPQDGPPRRTAQRPGQRAGVPRWLGVLVATGLVVAALNLRPAITSLGAVLQEVRHGLGMSGTVAGLLTSVPALCFGHFGTAAPRLARRWGVAPVVCGAMAAVAVGLLLRPFTGAAAGFLVCSALALAGMALGNVLMPVTVKRWFPDRIGSMTGLYSMAVSLGTAAAAALTVPIATASGGSWRAGLVVWAVPAVVAAVCWFPLARRPEPAADGGTPRDERRPPGLRVARSPTARALGCFFGLQATSAYITMGWLPQIFRDAGVPAASAGVLLAVTMGLGVPLSFVLPQIAARMRNQGALAVALGLCGLAGYICLHVAPAATAWPAALLLGISNCAFPLVLTLIGLRSRSGAGVVRVSAFVQSTGYLIAVPGPLVIGALYQHSGGWDVPLTVMAGLMVAQIALGVLAGRDRVVEDEC